MFEVLLYIFFPKITRDNFRMYMLMVKNHLTNLSMVEIPKNYHGGEEQQSNKNKPCKKIENIEVYKSSP